MRAPNPYPSESRVVFDTEEEVSASTFFAGFRLTTCVQDIAIPYGRPYDASERPPHPWFEWVSPTLRGNDDSYNLSHDWTLGSAYFCDSGSEECYDVEGGRRPTVMQRMKGWLRKPRPGP